MSENAALLSFDIRKSKFESLQTPGRSLPPAKSPRYDPRSLDLLRVQELQIKIGTHGRTCTCTCQVLSLVPLHWATRAKFIGGAPGRIRTFNRAPIWCFPRIRRSLCQLSYKGNLKWRNAVDSHHTPFWGAHSLAPRPGSLVRLTFLVPMAGVAPALAKV